MKVLIAEHSGFCEGVTRAYTISKKYQNVYMLGNLVHNSKVVEDLKQQGHKVVKSISEIPDGATVFISAHGVAPQVYSEAKDKGLRVIDTTCSWVKRAQKLASEAVRSGYQLIIIGDKNHPEVKGIMGWSVGRGIVVSFPGEVDTIKLADKVAVVAQTTQSEENFNNVVGIIQTRAKDLVVYNTICGATEKRQKAAIELAKNVDLMLVVGDEKSANTNRLTELCKKINPHTYQIQTRDELKNELLAGKEKIGITAGASTPDWIIQEVISSLKSHKI